MVNLTEMRGTSPGDSESEEKKNGINSELTSTKTKQTKSTKSNKSKTKDRSTEWECVKWVVVDGEIKSYIDNTSTTSTEGDQEKGELTEKAFAHSVEHLFRARSSMRSNASSIDMPPPMARDSVSILFKRSPTDGEPDVEDLFLASSFKQSNDVEDDTEEQDEDRTATDGQKSNAAKKVANKIGSKLSKTSSYVAAMGSSLKRKVHKKKVAQASESLEENSRPNSGDPKVPKQESPLPENNSRIGSVTKEILVVESLEGHDNDYAFDKYEPDSI